MQRHIYSHCFFVDESSYGAIQLVKYAGLFVFFRSIFILKSQTFSFYEILDTQIFFCQFSCLFTNNIKDQGGKLHRKKIGGGVDAAFSGCNYAWYK